jgi:hypothetical protein
MTSLHTLAVLRSTGVGVVLCITCTVYVRIHSAGLRQHYAQCYRADSAQQCHIAQCPRVELAPQYRFHTCVGWVHALCNLQPTLTHAVTCTESSPAACKRAPAKPFDPNLGESYTTRQSAERLNH